MKDRDKALNFLGLTQRAGHLVSGDEFVEEGAKRGQLYVLICARDASEKSLERYRKLSKAYALPLVTEFSREELAQALGKSRTMLGISNRGMAEKFMSYEDGEQTMK